MASDDQLFHQLGLALEPRPGWRYEPSTTPGAQPSWCLVVHEEIRLSASVIDGVHSIYLPEEDKEIDFDGREGLLAWIGDNQARFDQP